MSKHETLKATAQAYLLSPDGEVDGLLLDGDRQLKFPPHRAGEFLDNLKIGDTLEVEASPGHRSKHGQEFHFHKWLGDKFTLSVEGEVKHLLVDKEGELRGFILDDGSQVHVPKHLRKEVNVSKGLEINAEGHGHRTPHGTVIKADHVRVKAGRQK